MPASAKKPDHCNNPNIWGDLLVHADNSSAVLAAQALVQNLTEPNPLFLHGPPGVGKSAIVQELLKSFTAATDVRTAQVFPANELPRSTTNEDPIRELIETDLLIIEDLQYLPARDFDSLVRVLDARTSRERPTILTSTLAPALLDVPRKLTSRFVGGLVVRMNAPAFASRLLLTEHLALKKRVPLSADALEWIACQQTDGVRSLLGVLERLRPLAKRYPLGITKNQAAAWLADTDLEVKARRPSVLERIVTRVCAAFKVKSKDVIGSSRLRTVLVPRQVAMYLANTVANVPLKRIGNHFGGRDHSTVLHAVRKVRSEIKHDAKLARMVKELSAEVR